MKFCNICKINVNTTKSYCPLCNQTLKGESDSLPDPFPENIMPVRKIENLNKKILLFSMLFVIISLLIVNLVLYNGVFWCIIPIISVLYAWFIIRLGILSKTNTAFKILVLTTILILLLCLIGIVLNDFKWVIEYATPFLLVACSFAIGLIVLIKRIEWREYLFYLLSIAILGFAPIVFYYTKLIVVVWPALINALCSALIILGLFLFWSKPLKNEIQKRLHM
ncbi:MAG: DUF6320 domain-containing protein [Clostridia bacterium]|jgi:hypothetical protein|nr:DUF6320 domain-containing protein [Clostridia bacterium]MDD4275359.1 DUF6320 domain-containing protein [Clostridia bacterium]